MRCFLNIKDFDDGVLSWWSFTTDRLFSPSMASVRIGQSKKKTRHINTPQHPQQQCRVILHRKDTLAQGEGIMMYLDSYLLSNPHFSDSVAAFI